MHIQTYSSASSEKLQTCKSLQSVEHFSEAEDKARAFSDESIPFLGIGLGSKISCTSLMYILVCFFQSSITSGTMIAVRNSTASMSFTFRSAKNEHFLLVSFIVVAMSLLEGSSVVYLLVTRSTVPVS